MQWNNHNGIISRLNLQPLNNRRTVARIVFLCKIVNNRIRCSVPLHPLKLYVPPHALTHSNLFLSTFLYIRMRSHGYHRWTFATRQTDFTIIFIFSPIELNVPCTFFFAVLFTFRANFTSMHVDRCINSPSLRTHSRATIKSRNVRCFAINLLALFIEPTILLCFAGSKRDPRVYYTE